MIHRGGITAARIESTHARHPSSTIRWRPTPDSPIEYVLVVRRRGRYSSNVTHIRFREFDEHGRPNPTVIYHGVLNSEHPAADCECCLCPELLGCHQPVSLRIIGADNPTERARQALRMEFKAVALFGHTDCLSPQALEQWGGC